jgi:hypothetical protein
MQSMNKIISTTVVCRNGHLSCFLLPVAVVAAEQPTAHTDLRPVAAWSLGTLDAGVVPDTAGRLPASIVGAPESVAGVEGAALKLDGMGDYATVAAADAIAFADAPFSITAWINVYALDRGQQMIVAKNVYAANQREWGLMIDADNRFRFYLWDQGWKTVGSQTEPQPRSLDARGGDGRPRTGPFVCQR